MAWYEADGSNPLTGTPNQEVNGAAQFTAANSEYMTRSDSAAISVSSATDFTVCCLAYLDSLVARGTLIAKDDTASQREWSLYAHAASGTFKFQIAGIDAVASTVTPTTGVWYFLLLTHTSSGQIITLAVNGVDATNTYAGTMSDSSARLEFGNISDDTGIYWYNGRICRVGFWKRLLTAAERTWLYNSGAGRVYSECLTYSGMTNSMVAYWNLGETSGTRVDSHAGLNLTDNNTVTFNPGPGHRPASNLDYVARWNDLSGNGNHLTQITSGKLPQYTTAQQNGRGAMVFTGSESISSATPTTAQPVTIIAAVKPATDATARVVVSGASGSAANMGLDVTNNFTLTGGTVLADLNGSAQFTAANSEYLSRASEAALQTGDIDFTWAAWVRYDTGIATDDRSRIISKFVAGNWEYILDLADNSTVERFRFNVSSTGSDLSGVIANTFGTPPTASWCFVIGNHNSTANTIGIQVNNGTEDTASYTLGVYAGSSVFNVGRDESGVYYHNGRISRVGFWKRILTAAERTWLYNAGAGRVYSELSTSDKVSLVAYWNLDETSGTRVDSHAGLNLTDNNTVTWNPGPAKALSQIWVAELNGNSSKLYRNGGLVKNGPGGANSMTGIAIGTDHAGAQFWKDNVLEAFVFNSILSAGDRARAENYLRSKYAAY